MSPFASRPSRRASFMLVDLFPEREEGEARELPVLDREGDPDDRDRTERGEDHVRERDPDSSHEEPDHVHDEREPGAELVLRPDRAPERNEPDDRELHALNAERDPDDRAAEEEAREQILEEDRETAAEEDPEDVSEETHA